MRLCELGNLTLGETAAANLAHPKVEAFDLDGGAVLHRPLKFIVKQACPGIVDVLHRSHHTHVLWQSGSSVWCSKCAAYATVAVRALGLECPGKALGRRQRTLQRLVAGLHPHAGDPLLRPVRVFTR